MLSEVSDIGRQILQVSTDMWKLKKWPNRSRECNRGYQSLRNLSDMGDEGGIRLVNRCIIIVIHKK